ncbi:MAG TPA: sulfotransferase family protein [Gemmatimonadaceae bacterium]|nr:sulfotransferase family protein [Gemmatimonadaceae bacterium]
MGLGYAVSRILDTYPELDSRTVEKRLAYGSFAHLNDRVVYLEVPKAACTVVKMTLRELYSSTPLTLFPHQSRQTRRRMFVHARANAPLPALTELDDAAQRELLEEPDVLRFTVVRNPYTRCVSAWRDKVYLCEPTVEDVYRAVRGGAPDLGAKRPVEFPEFVSHVERTIGPSSDAHWRRQVDLTYPKAVGFTHVGQTEHLVPTMARLYAHVRRDPPAAIPRENGAALVLGATYTESIVARVRAIYERDFSAFGYDPSRWPEDAAGTGRSIGLERFVDEIMERNVIIAHLYDEHARLASELKVAYRFSLTRLANTWRRMFAPRGRA